MHLAQIIFTLICTILVDKIAKMHERRYKRETVYGLNCAQSSVANAACTEWANLMIINTANWMFAAFCFIGLGGGKMSAFKSLPDTLLFYHWSTWPSLNTPCVYENVLFSQYAWLMIWLDGTS